MYRRKYLSFDEAVRLISERLASTKPASYDTSAALGPACEQLIQSLSDGAVHSEGIMWEAVEPEPYEPEPLLPGKHVPIDRRFWLHENCYAMTRDDDGRLKIQLDIVTVYPKDSGISFDDELGTPCAYEKIRMPSLDLSREFFASRDAQQPALGPVEEEEATPVVEHEAYNAHSTTYRTGAAGRPTSMHLIEAEMRRRFDAREQLPTMRQEAEHLSQWLPMEHPLAAPTKPKTIKNQLGARYKQLKAQIPK